MDSTCFNHVVEAEPPDLDGDVLLVRAAGFLLSDDLVRVLASTCEFACLPPSGCRPGLAESRGCAARPPRVPPVGTGHAVRRVPHHMEALIKCFARQGNAEGLSIGLPQEHLGNDTLPSAAGAHGEARMGDLSTTTRGGAWVAHKMVIPQKTVIPSLPRPTTEPKALRHTMWCSSTCLERQARQ